LAERLWVHLNGHQRRTPDEPYATPIEVISAAYEAGNTAKAEEEFRAWTEWILVDVLGMGLEFKLLALVGKLKEALHAKNPVIWAEGDAEKTRNDMRDTLMGIYKIAELANYNEEGEWIGPSP
jgi:hypothetical protein